MRGAFWRQKCPLTIPLSQVRYSDMTPRASANTTYLIDGFRSLREFAIELHPGLNALVGPNGSGKTNFLDFLGFIDAALHSGATHAISHAGGIARVFSQENTTRHSAHLKAVITGLADLRDTNASDPILPYFYYEYEIEIRFSREQSSIYISNELLRFKKLHSLSTDPTAAKHSGKIEVRRRSASPDIRPSWQIGSRTFSEKSRNPLTVLDREFLGRNGKVRDRLENIIVAPDQSFLSIGTRYNFAALEAVRSAITRGRSFNLLPEKSRTPDDISRQPGIDRDGTGLTATLHALQSLRRSPKRVPRLRLARRSTMEEIVEWTKIVFPQLREISVSQDPHTGKYLANLVIGENPSLRLPMTAASDGTLKWLSLVCLILAIGGVYSIEEPENFLHPKMQQYLVEIIRESISESGAAAYFLFSTHSETLINFVHPSELIIFDYRDNRTTCSRIVDPERIMQEINRTGFGLGYYYASNALPTHSSLGRRDHGEEVYQ